MALGAAACGSSSKSSSSSNETTTTAAASQTTVSGPTTTLAPITCNGTSAYVKDIGKASDFKPVTADTLTVVTSLPGPGFWDGSNDDPTKITGGYEYEIAQKLQQAFGLKHLVTRNENFDSITAGTVTKYDLSLTQASITCDRAKAVTFSIPYFASTQGILMKTGSKPITTLDDVKKAQWGVQTSTTAIDLLKKIGTDKQPKVFQQLPDAYTALQAGEIDAVLIDTAINLREAAQSHGLFTVVGQFQTKSGPDQYGAIFPKGSTNIPAVNAVLKQLQDSGQLNQLAIQANVGSTQPVPVIDVSAVA
jgi:polar amino acid transport system substrate-binding protein